MPVTRPHEGDSSRVRSYRGRHFTTTATGGGPSPTPAGSSVLDPLPSTPPPDPRGLTMGTRVFRDFVRTPYQKTVGRDYGRRKGHRESRSVSSHVSDTLFEGEGADLHTRSDTTPEDGSSLRPERGVSHSFHARRTAPCRPSTQVVSSRTSRLRPS